MTKEEVLSQLKGKYRCEQHPEDKRAIVIYDITLKEFCKLCAKYHCSGHYNEDRSAAVALNFGMYK